MATRRLTSSNACGITAMVTTASTAPAATAWATADELRARVGEHRAAEDGGQPTARPIAPSTRIANPGVRPPAMIGCAAP